MHEFGTVANSCIGGGIFRTLQLFGEQRNDVQNHLGGLFNALQRGEFELAVEVEASGENVGAGQALEAEIGAVGAAADGLDLCLDPRHLHGLDGLVDDVVVGLHLFPHIIVLVLDDGRGGAGAVLGVDGVGHLLHHFLAGFELGAVVVPDDVGKVGLLYGSLEGDEVEEALVALRVFRAGQHGQHGVQFLSDVDGVLHLALGIAGVHVTALDVDFGRCRVEVLELQLTDLSAVHGVGEVGAEAGDVKLDHAAADFFVGGKADAHLAVLEFRVLHHVLHGVHNLGHAGFVVGAPG